MTNFPPFSDYQCTLYLLANNFVNAGCKVYALTGGVFGTISILSMVVIGYDRYNVICKGFSGVKITPTKVGIFINI